MNLTQLEQELVWLTKKVKADESLIQRAEDFFDAKQYLWSRDVLAYFLDMLERKKEQLYYEQHRLEKLAWQIVMERDANLI